MKKKNYYEEGIERVYYQPETWIHPEGLYTIIRKKGYWIIRFYSDIYNGKIRTEVWLSEVKNIVNRCEYLFNL